jgi:hypothetical protein
MEPPEKFELNKMQSIMIKYLPKNVSGTISKQKARKSDSHVMPAKMPTMRKANS